MKYLRDLIADDKLVEKLSLALSDLRADFELDLETSKDKIEELLKLHVNTKDHLEYLSTISKNSSGVVQGLRGTGKTHLMLLARHKINQKLLSDKNFCIYINLKRFDLPNNATQDIFNRIFACFIYESIISQLIIEIKSNSPKGLFKKLLNLPPSDSKEFIKSLRAAIELISTKSLQALSGSTSVEILESYQQKILDQNESAIQALEKAEASITTTSGSSKLNIEKSRANKTLSSEHIEATSLRFFDTTSIHSTLKELIKITKINSFIFYIDEWEKIYNKPNIQKWAAETINKLIDTPIYFWIAYVPHRGSLSPLSVGADLQHSIDLDTDLIIENSKKDRQACIEYFTEFVNKRLQTHIGTQTKINTLINNKKKLELLILGSMGNTRDFGTILLAAYQNYKSYRQGQLKQGKPFQYISDQHIRDAIKSDGKNKLGNIKEDSTTITAWNDVVDFITSKKSSHFAVKETTSEREALRTREFSELIYQRLIHIRKTGVEPKDASTDSKLTILAASYSATEELHSRNKKIEYIKDNAPIDSRVRRYIYTPSKVIRTIRVREGQLHPCKTCGESIDSEKMKAAWIKNSCPFCGGVIFNSEE